MRKLFCTLFISLGLFIITTNIFSAASDTPATTVNQLNAFAFQLYRQLKLPNENQIFSPYGVSSSLGNLLVGSEGETRNQMMRLFQLKTTPDVVAISSTLKQINTALINSTPCFGWFSCQFKKWTNKQDLIIANAFWADKTFMYKSAYLEQIEQDKTVHFYVIDFAENPEAARRSINHWVENQTNNMIKNLMRPGSVSSETRLVLTNAIYFKGKWELPFKAENTTQKLFTLSDQRQIQVPMMTQKEDMDYMKNNKLQVLKMTYQKSPLAMLIILPREKVNLEKVIHKMTPELLNQLLQSLQRKKMLVNIPKFTMESNFDSLDTAITSMGLKDAFTEKANFSPMTGSKLIVSKIIQKAFIQVDEEGTVAAAATGAMMAGAAPAKPIEFFNANRPFLFLIYDTESKIILFMGQVMNPQS